MKVPHYYSLALLLFISFLLLIPFFFGEQKKSLYSTQTFGLTMINDTIDFYFLVEIFDTIDVDKKLSYLLNFVLTADEAV